MIWLRAMCWRLSFEIFIHAMSWFFIFILFVEDGYQWEEGPNSFQPSPTILRFAKDIGIIDELILADSTLPRFVFWEGKLYPLPSKLSDPVLNFNLMTWPGKIRAGLGAIGLIAARPKEEESVKQFVTRHLGLYTSSYPLKGYRCAPRSDDSYLPTPTHFTTSTTVPTYSQVESL